MTNPSGRLNESTVGGQVASRKGKKQGWSRALSVIGIPSSAGAFAAGQEGAPTALREAGLIDGLRSVGADVEDLGDSPLVRWRPDRARPRAQNLSSVVQQVRIASERVRGVLDAGRTPLVLGGDCTIGIGTVAGSRQALSSVGLIYFDLHADMNIPTSVQEGALDWMGVAHMLGLDGATPTLVSAVMPGPILHPTNVVLFAHGWGQATAWERQQIDRLRVPRVPLEQVASDPEGAAERALQMIRGVADRYVVHFDVDVIDFTDAPLSENIGRNAGLSLAQAMKALRRLLSSDRVAALTVTELNPQHAIAEEGMLPRFAATLSDAWTQHGGDSDRQTVARVDSEIERRRV
jgi:arginase